MSALENESKHSLIKLIKNEKIYLTSDIQRTLAAWIAMSFIMAEYTDPKTVAITKAEREFLKKNLLPPSNWKIWIGRYSGDAWKDIRYRHHGISVTSAPFDLKRKISVNTQTSTQTIGALFIHAFSTNRPENEIKINDPVEIFKPYMQLIWPITLEGNLLTDMITDTEALIFSDWILNQSNSLKPSDTIYNPLETFK